MPSIELKPCPFCGGEAEVLEDRVRVWGLIQHSPECWLAYDMPRFRQELPKAEFKSWNTRAERTCRMDYVGYIGTEESHASIYQCSKCSMRYMSANVPDSGEYCMACGAKVVEE